MQKTKKTSYPLEILNQFKAVQRTDRRWAIQLDENKFLHWIEVTDDRPVTISSRDMAMQSWVFKEEAEGIIGWLKKRWSQDPNVNAEMFDKITVTVKIEDDYEE